MLSASYSLLHSQSISSITVETLDYKDTSDVAKKLQYMHRKSETNISTVEARQEFIFRVNKVDRV